MAKLDAQARGRVTDLERQPGRHHHAGCERGGGVALDVNGNPWVTHQNTATSVEEFAAANSAAAGSYTPSAKATIGGFSKAQQPALDPPPYKLPLSH
ncbi:MAG: hypothetical protein P8Z81_16330 [Deinococcales bacterium]